LYYYNTGGNAIPYSVLLITFPFAFFQLFFYRLFVKELFAFVKNVDDTIERTNVAVFGAGSLGLSIKQMIETHRAAGCGSSPLWRRSE